MKMPLKASLALPWAKACLAERQKQLDDQVAARAIRKRSFWFREDIVDWELAGYEMRRDRTQNLHDRLLAAKDMKVILDADEVAMLSPYM
jgi:hypothetical protein